jgi:hypothetical protein
VHFLLLVGLVLGIALWVAGLALYRNNISLRSLIGETGFEEATELTEEVHDLLGGHRRAQRIEFAIGWIGQALTVVAVLAIIVVLIRRWTRGGARSARDPERQDEADWLGDRRN